MDFAADSRLTLRPNHHAGTNGCVPPDSRRERWLARVVCRTAGGQLPGDALFSPAQRRTSPLLTPRVARVHHQTSPATFGRNCRNFPTRLGPGRTRNVRNPREQREFEMTEGYSGGIVPGSTRQPPALPDRPHRRRLSVQIPSKSAKLEILNTFAYTCGFSRFVRWAAPADHQSWISRKKYLEWGKRNLR